MAYCQLVTWNLRYAWDSDGANSFIHRAGLVLETISEACPDIIAFQEVLPQTAAFLRRHLPDYTMIYSGRNPDLKGEGLCLALRRDQVELMTLDRFWLSPTPREPGSRYPQQSPNPRVCQLASVLVEDTPLWVCNNHLDDLSETARLLGIGQVLDHVATHREPAAPLLLCGDLNATPESPVVARCRESGLVDLTADSGGTFHDFGRRQPVKLDYIFGDAAAAARPHVMAVWRDEVNGIYLSDHYPVSVTVDL